MDGMQKSTCRRYVKWVLADELRGKVLKVEPQMQCSCIGANAIGTP